MKKGFTESKYGLVLRVKYDGDDMPIADVYLEADPRYGASLMWALNECALYRNINDEDVRRLSKRQIAQIEKWAATI